MTELAALAMGAMGGAGIVWLLVRGRLNQLVRLTDRDPKTGRFWKAPGE